MMVSNSEHEANELVRATSVERARAEFAADPRLRPIGGGTAVVSDLRAGATAGRWLATTAIDGLDGVGVDGAGDLAIGAAARLRQVELDPRVREGWPLLARAMAAIAGPAIRNAATIGGSLALGHSSPDPAVALSALNASVEVSDSNRRIAVADLPTADEATRPQFIEQVHVPAERIDGWAYQRFTVRGESDRPFVIVAVVASSHGSRVDVAVGRPRPLRLNTTAAAVDAGLDWRAALEEEVAALVLDDTGRGAGAYRSRVLHALARRAIESATGSERRA